MTIHILYIGKGLLIWRYTGGGVTIHIQVTEKPFTSK